jgi:hypothetical protein
MNKFIFLLMVGFAAINCSDSSTNYIEIELDQEFEIKVGDSAILANQGLIIKFKAVTEDSRCPIDAICVWAGNAAVTFDLKNSINDKLTAQLNTYLDPRSINFSDVTITLTELNPYPKSNEPIDSDNYIAKLIVKDREN